MTVELTDEECDELTRAIILDGKVGGDINVFTTVKKIIQAHLEKVTYERDNLIVLIREAIDAHHDLHQFYGNSLACHGGIGSAVVTQHCGVTCSIPENHENELARWNKVVESYPI